MRSSLEEKLTEIKVKYVDLTEWSDLSTTGIYRNIASGRPEISRYGNEALKNAIIDTTIAIKFENIRK